MIKILLVVPLSTLEGEGKSAGGVDAVAQILVKHLGERGDTPFHYRVLAFDPYSHVPRRSPVIRVSDHLDVVRIPLNESMFGIRLPGILTQALAVREQVSEYSPDIVHSHVSAWLLGVSRNAKRIATIHSYKWMSRKKISLLNDFFYTKIIPKLSVRFTDFHTCVGENLREAMFSDSIYNVELIHNPIRQAYFDAKPRGKKTGKNKLRMVTCSIITRRKRIDKAVTILSELVRRGTDASLTVIGSEADRDYYHALLNLVSNLNLQNRVNFLGMLGATKIIAEYEQADLGIFCSEDETFGLAPMEMLAAGLPLLTTEVGIFSERRKYFEGMGVRFLSDDYSSNIESIDVLLSGCDNQNWRERLRVDFSVGSAVKQYEEAYARILEQES